MISDADLLAAKDDLPPLPIRIELGGYLWERAVEAARNGGDARPLADYIRRNEFIGPDERAFIAEVLLGNIETRPIKHLPVYHFSREALLAHLSEYAHLILGDRIYVIGDWDETYDKIQEEVGQIERALRKLGISLPIKGRGDATIAAKLVLCEKLAPTTMSQLDGYLSPRKRSAVSRENAPDIHGKQGRNPENT